MDFISLLKVALKAISKNKVRAGLTTLGIIIGIYAVVTLVALGKGAENYIVDQVASAGSNLIAILPGKSESEFSAPPAQQGLTITSLTYTDEQYLKNVAQIPYVKSYAPEVRGQFQVTSPYQETDCILVGTDADYFSVRNTKIINGTVFTNDDVDAQANLAVVGPKIAKSLYPNQDPIGQSVKINQLNFKIVGVTEEKGVEDGQDRDKFIYIPVTTAQKKLLGINHLFAIYAETDKKEDLPLAKAMIANVLRDRHNIDDPAKDDFTIYDTQEALDILSSITDILSILLAAIAAISLIVGGIGIMNIMLVSVKERTREIGLRKAIGATPFDILVQFLIEAVILTIIGGIIGVLFGYLTVILVNYFANFRAEVTTDSIILAVGVSSIFGLVFGLYPARQASLLNPIEALRYE